MLSLSALIFAWALIRSGADPKTTIGLTLALELGIVAIVVPAVGGASRRRRMLDIVRVLLGDGSHRG